MLIWWPRLAGVPLCLHRLSHYWHQFVDGGFSPIVGEHRHPRGVVGRLNLEVLLLPGKDDDDRPRSLWCIRPECPLPLHDIDERLVGLVPFLRPLVSSLHVGGHLCPPQLLHVPPVFPACSLVCGVQGRRRDHPLVNVPPPWLQGGSECQSHGLQPLVQLRLVELPRRPDLHDDHHLPSRGFFKPVADLPCVVEAYFLDVFAVVDVPVEAGVAGRGRVLPRSCQGRVSVGRCAYVLRGFVAVAWFCVPTASNFPYSTVVSRRDLS